MLSVIAIELLPSASSAEEPILSGVGRIIARPTSDGSIALAVSRYLRSRIDSAVAAECGFRLGRCQMPGWSQRDPVTPESAGEAGMGDVRFWG
jgi:hypothetical protein